MMPKAKPSDNSFSKSADPLLFAIEESHPSLGRPFWEPAKGFKRLGKFYLAPADLNLSQPGFRCSKTLRRLVISPFFDGRFGSCFESRLAVEHLTT